MRILLAALGLCANVVFADEAIWSTRESRWVTLEEAAAAIPAGAILLIGEVHASDDGGTGDKIHHDNQLRLIRALTPLVSVGMEFFSYNRQPLVDQYLSGALAESDFLTRIEWGSSPFAFYREQVRAPSSLGGHTWALNMPREITRAVSRGGPESLTPAEREYLPPLWEKGSDTYFERFQELMGGGHIADQAMERYFWAQSLWDDTMAWQSVLRARPSEVFAVIVGYFHVEFGDGLAARMRAHGASDVRTLVQLEVDDVADLTELRKRTADPRWGPRADFVWFYTVNSARQ